MGSPAPSSGSLSPSPGWVARLSPFCVWLQRLLDSNVALACIVVLTLAALFLDDFRVAVCPPAGDKPFAITMLLIFIFFSVELLLNSLVKPGYLLGFFFWLDLVAALSLLPDIPFIWMPMVGLRAEDEWVGAGAVERAVLVSRSNTSLARLERFIRLLRLVRIAKLFELCQRKAEERSQCRKRSAAVAANAAMAAAAVADSDNATSPDSDEQAPRPLQVGQHLSEQTTRKVVLLVLFMLFGIPLLQPTLDEYAHEYTLQGLHSYASSNLSLGAYTGPVYEPALPPAITQQLTPGALQAANATMHSEVDWVRRHYDGQLLYLRLRGTFAPPLDYTSPDLKEHRTSEVEAAQVGTDSSDFDEGSLALFSIRASTRRQAVAGLVTTTCVLLLLGLGAVLFNRNNHRMVIVPIERMLATIHALQQNPLARASLNPGNGGAAGGGGVADGDAGLGAAGDHNNETGMLERTLEKLTGLLQVGFGEAGSAMISKCMNLNAAGELDPLVDGSKMLAIFGFCDIRRFTDATECLREDVMMYVNEIAAIVHSNVSSMDGSPNKNIGDAFLLVWRLPSPYYMDGDDLFQMNEHQPTLCRPTVAQVKKRAALRVAANAAAAAALATNPDSEDSEAAAAAAAAAAHAESLQVELALEVEQEAKDKQDAMLDRAKKAGASIPPQLRPLNPNVRQQVSVLADKALVSFLRIIVEIDASEEVRKYANHHRIKEAFEHFEVQLGFGLHCGWAIEGPIGSRFKIDASYLSPHVNLSETLQDATKIYGTPLLMSGEFYSLLSPYMKCYCRRIDVVKVAGREAPMNLYTFDIHPQALAAIIANEMPQGYEDSDAIQVVELKGKNAILAEIANAAATGAASSSAAAAAALLSSHSGLLPFSAPLSPSAGSGGVSSRAQFVHDLFRNPYLNAHISNFTAVDFDSDARRLIQERGPIGSYHLVRGFRLSALQCGIPRSFFDAHARALELYLDGSWAEARKALLEAQKLYPEDVPSKVIMGVMREHGFVAPPEWAGFHEV